MGNYKIMGKRSKSSSSVKELQKGAKKRKYQADIKISNTKPPQNEAKCSKNKKRRSTPITHSNEPVKHKLKLEENMEAEEAETVELSPVKKEKTNKKNKTHINKETNESVFQINIVAAETENVEVEDAESAEYTKKVKTNKKTKKKRAAQDDIETNVAAVESKTGDSLTDLSNNKVKTKKKNNGKLDKESKTVGTDNKSIEIDNQMAKPKNLKKQLSQEDDVKDEDIDMFCEELSEEDNVQYNNWVELIEAKLSSNKKKPK